MSGKYIVVFKDSVSASQIDEYVNQVNSNGGEVSKRFNSLLNGFAATIPDSFLTQLQSLQGGVIDYIEPDSEVRIQ
ncbi:protease propeptide/inhibitor [Laetiporus sulphureus 93-53]|uniref:Protease propeptide/inhibitor n=1 Tax=Laetiporus sulphureus 93-53 TaxID=1314785 RepID=A0A165GPT0_9APHY|nr:protease propeptide/inhibitor [Laetiporus sulphureus 93-53]KZT10640.1 protease propeptide/inhibitor [Laetiporus sulphureus 93-53]